MDRDPQYDEIQREIQKINNEIANANKANGATSPIEILAGTIPIETYIHY